jgi:hypothetical protein
MLIKPLSNAISAEEVGAIRELRTAAYDVYLAYLTNELFSLAQELVLLHFDFIPINII